MSSAYLLIVGCVVYDIGHQNWQEFSHSIDTSGEGAIGCGVARRLSSLASSFYPLSGYRVYDVEYSQLVGARGLLEMGENLLDENGFILNVCCAKSGDTLDLGSRYSRWFQGQHGLEKVLQLRYGGRHDIQSAGVVPRKIEIAERVPFSAALLVFVRTQGLQRRKWQRYFFEKV